MNAIEYYRNKFSLTQEELANQMGVTQSAVSAWEKGKRTPDLETVLQLAKIFNVSGNEILDLNKEYDFDFENTSVGNLKIFRKRAGLTQDDVAEKLGITKAAVSNWETGKGKPSQENVLALAELYKVKPDDLVNQDAIPKVGKTLREKPEPEFAEAAFLVPLVANLQCGYDHNGQSSQVTYYDVIRKYELPPSYRTKYGEDIVLIKAKGKSMMPTIRPGDLLICKPGDVWVEGKIFVINFDDSDTIKRIYRAKDGGIDLVPDNPECRITHFTIEDLEMYPPRVLGRIVRNYGQDL